VHRALALEERRRPQTVAELRALLSAGQSVRKSGIRPARFTSEPRKGAAAGARAARKVPPAPAPAPARASRGRWRRLGSLSRYTRRWPPIRRRDAMTEPPRPALLPRAVRFAIARNAPRW